MGKPVPSDPISAGVAEVIQGGFENYQAVFRQITLRANTRFENCDWQGVHQDTVERLELYKKTLDAILPVVRGVLRDQDKDRSLWSRIKEEYSHRIQCCPDIELAETFFNSITRRIFTTVGVEPSIEFLDTEFDTFVLPEELSIFRVYSGLESDEPNSMQQLVRDILNDFPFQSGYAKHERDCRLATIEIKKSLRSAWGEFCFDHIEMLTPVFYRNNGAYLIGRIYRYAESSEILPLVFCLRNLGSGIFVDAVLLDEDDVSILFSFTRSYFHVAVQSPHALVVFLKSIMPLKRIAELYISIGYNKHGKSELYRELIHHLSNTKDQFKIVPGERGMVMLVFGMDSYDVVFKLIKDVVDPPKSTTREEVMQRYDLVFNHDRAGRLVDAQEFEHLCFDRRCFSIELLAELQRCAPSLTTITDGTVSIKHLYTERRLTPLNLFIQQATPEHARQAVLDYGKAIKDLASTNIFPGDVLLKNFGVTRHGRVVFYDYDELCLLTDLKFRKAPAASDFYDEIEADAWFYVGPNDIFPEEFRTFLGLNEPLRSIFIDQHADLFEVDFWRRMQATHRAGKILEILPYPDSKRMQTLS